MTLVYRTFRDADLAAIAALLAEGLEHDRPSAAYVRYLLLDDPSFDPELTYVADDGGVVAGFAAGVLADEPRQSQAGIKLFGVSPAYRRRGIASRLFDLTEGALRERGVEECVPVNSGNHRLSLGLDVRYTAALCLLLGRGYKLTGSTQDMEVDLTNSSAVDLSTDADEARLRANGTGVRRARANDRGWVREGVERAMVPPTLGRRWAYLAEQAFRTDPPTIEVAEHLKTGGFLGFAAYNAARWGALGPMGLAPDARGAGLGGVVLKRCLRDMRADGHQWGQIFAVGPIPFYAKTVNARISRVFYRYTKLLGRP